MHPLCAFDEAPLQHVAPANMARALGLRDAGIAARIASSRLLAAEAGGRILSALPPAPAALPPARAQLFAELAMAAPEALSALCRVMTVLINHKAILATTSGAALTEIVDWCGSRALVLGLREARLPAFGEFRVLSTASGELLDLYARKVKAHLIGVLPPAYRERLKLRLVPEELLEPLSFAPGDPDEACFLRYVALAREHGNAQA